MIFVRFFLLGAMVWFVGCSSKPQPNVIGATEHLYLQPVSFERLPYWKEHSLQEAFESFQKSCQSPHNPPHFAPACQAAFASDITDFHHFFQTHFTPYEWIDPNDKPALVTGYYEPLLEGSREKNDTFCYPVLMPPKDLIKVKLDEIIPELKGKTIRGRLLGDTLVPYYTRAQMAAQETPENVLCWVKDKVELFFFHIQGSGRIALVDRNETIYVGYADKNGHPYASIGNYMLKNNLMPYANMSLEGIKNWAQANPEKIDEILNQNPSYVFFVEKSTPAKGAQGVVLTPRHSVAVDTAYIPLGTPIFMITTLPKTQEPYAALTVAQDKGAAITGGRRVDYFWGFGPQAAALAGATKQDATLVLLLPKNFAFNRP